VAIDGRVAAVVRHHLSRTSIYEFGASGRHSLAGPPTGSIAGSGLPPQTLPDPAIGNLPHDLYD